MSQANRKQPKQTYTRPTRTVSLGALIAAAYDVAGSAEGVARVLQSPTLQRRLRARLQLVPA